VPTCIQKNENERSKVDVNEQRAVNEEEKRRRPFSALPPWNISMAREKQ